MLINSSGTGDFVRITPTDFHILSPFLCVGVLFFIIINFHEKKINGLNIRYEGYLVKFIHHYLTNYNILEHSVCGI